MSIDQTFFEFVTHLLGSGSFFTISRQYYSNGQQFLIYSSFKIA